MDLAALDEKVNFDELNKDIKEAAENGGTGEFPELPAEISSQRMTFLLYTMWNRNRKSHPISLREMILLTSKLQSPSLKARFLQSIMPTTKAPIK